MKAVGLLDRALALESPLQINEFMSLAKDPEAVENETTTSGPPPSERELEAALPRDDHERSSKLDDMIVDRLSRFLRTRTLQFSLPADLIEGIFAED